MQKELLEIQETDSMSSTFIAGQVLKKLLNTYPDKAAGQQAVSDKKAAAIYAALERHPDVYRIVPEKSVRSRMNICFRVTRGGDVDAAEKLFLKESTAQGLTGLKGHRSVGGIRASNCGWLVLRFLHTLANALSDNSIPLEGAEKLAAFIDSFAKA